jgi:hypothetical protein
MGEPCILEGIHSIWLDFVVVVPYRLYLSEKMLGTSESWKGMNTAVICIVDSSAVRFQSTNDSDYSEN